jgi:hypothetical protein
MKQYLILLLLFGNFAHIFAQENSDQINRQSRESIDRIEHDGAFFFSPGSREWDYFLEFSRALSTKDLIGLTNNWNYATRCYSFFALAKKHSPVVDSILQAHLQDTAVVLIMIGDDGDHEAVGDFFYNVVTNRFFKDVLQLDSTQKKGIDSLLIFRPGVMLKAKANLLQSMSPKIAWYDRIREMATGENDKSAVVALSKYRNERDLPLIESLLKSPDRDLQYLGLRSVRNYPDPALFPYVKQIHQTEIHRTGGFDYAQICMLYQAIVQFKDRASRQLLIETIKKAKSWTLKYHSEDIWLALTQSPDPIYSDIIAKLKIESYRFEELRQRLKNIEN